MVARADLWVYNAENLCVSFFYQVTSIFHLRGGKINKRYFWAYLMMIITKWWWWSLSPCGGGRWPPSWWSSPCDGGCNKSVVWWNAKARRSPRLDPNTERRHMRRWWDKDKDKDIQYIAVPVSLLDWCWDWVQGGNPPYVAVQLPRSYLADFGHFSFAKSACPIQCQSREKIRCGRCHFFRIEVHFPKLRCSVCVCWAGVNFPRVSNLQPFTSVWYSREIDPCPPRGNHRHRRYTLIGKCTSILESNIKPTVPHICLILL